MKKINYEFLTLQFLAIVFVVAGHSGVDTPFVSLFPVYSFHMPLFVFISGYFYKSNETVKSYLKKIIKKFLIPLTIWNIIYTTIAQVFRTFNIINFGQDISFNSIFIAPIYGTQLSLNTSAWFVWNLILLTTLYILIRKFLLLISKNEYFITVVIFILSLVATQIAMNNQLDNNQVLLTRSFMQLFYFQIGYLYKQKLERKDKLNSWIYFSIILIIQMAILIKYHNISSVVLSMTFSYNFSLIAFIVAMTGIAFWLRIAKLLTPLFKKNKAIIYAGQNTWTIMMHHQFVFFLINFGFYLLSKVVKYNIRFDNLSFANDKWYSYLRSLRFQYAVVYCILGIVIPLLIKYYYNKFKERNRHEVN